VQLRRHLIFLVLASRNNLQRIIRQWPLQRLRRSLRPFDCTMRMIICSLSMSPAHSRTTSLARSPQP
jgi:hypothetical protein